MSNRLYLMCAPCMEENTEDFGFRLADRGVIGAYEVFGPSASAKNLTQWLKKHQKCGGKGNPDHFNCALLNPKNHDQPKEAIKDALVLQ